MIVASGGFDHNAELRARHLPPEGAEDYSSGAPTNTGDGQLAAGQAGAALARMDDAWWAPTCLIPGAGPQIVIFERGKPGQIIGDAGGRRFANEAQPYGDFVREMFDAHRSSEAAIPAFMVFDQTYRDRYPIGNLLPGRTPQRAIDSGFLARADSVDALCRIVGIDVDGLSGTLARFNGMAARGIDEDFQRGESAFDRYGGDPTVAPNPCLAPIRRPPFYALKIYPGDIGAHGGVSTNEFAQALDGTGEPIEGLYAVGNCAASALGGFYPGAGGTSEYDLTSRAPEEDSCPVAVDLRPGGFRRLGCWTSFVQTATNDEREVARVDIEWAAGERHLLRFGVDTEENTSFNSLGFSGGGYFLYLPVMPGDILSNGAAVPEGVTEATRYIQFSQRGHFDVIATAFYIEDEWSIAPLNATLRLGLRNERFDNRNAEGESFIKIQDQYAPRIGFS